MNDLIDEISKKIVTQSEKSKLYNLITFGIVFSIVAYTVFKVIYTKNNLDSPLLPEYTSFYMNASLINFSVIQFSGIFPALILRFGKQYTISTYCLIAFIILGLILKDSVSIYEYFYL